jgi:hypothetical protein
MFRKKGFAELRIMRQASKAPSWRVSGANIEIRIERGTKNGTNRPE